MHLADQVHRILADQGHRIVVPRGERKEIRHLAYCGSTFQVGSFSGSLVINKKTSLQDMGGIILEAAEKPPKDEDNMSLLESGDAVKVLAAALARLAEDSNKDTAKAAWQETGLELSSFLAEVLLLVLFKSSTTIPRRWTRLVEACLPKFTILHVSDTTEAQLNKAWS